MKSKCSFILKALTAMVLAVILLFSTVATGVAAIVEDIADTGAQVDVAETGWGNYQVYSTTSDSWNSGNSWPAQNNSTSEIDLTRYIGRQIKFKVNMSYDGGTSGGSGISGTTAISYNTQVDLVWGGGNDIKYNVTGGKIKFWARDNNGNKFKVSQDSKWTPSTSFAMPGGTRIYHEVSAAVGIQALLSRRCFIRATVR